MRAVRVAALLASLAFCPAMALGASSESGDFVHTPAPEQRANTPLPIYIEYSGEPLGRVIVKYAGPGVKPWSRLEMKRVGRGWGALVPCGDVKVGTMRYWVQGFDTNGEAVATSGDPKNPFVVPIRDAITAKPPHLPGQAAPSRCDGTQAPAVPEVTTSVEPPPIVPEGTRHVEPDERTQPEPREAPFARWWFGIAGSLDLLALPAGADVCALSANGTPANAPTYYCTNPDGSDFPARSPSGRQNAMLVAGQSGQVVGGFQPSDVRVLVTVDYAVNPAILVGARLGYVLNAYPIGGAAVTDGHAFGTRLHLEARGTYVFGDQPLAHAGFAPTVFAAVGVAEFDGHTVALASYVVKSGQAPVTQPVNAWLTSGPWFAAAGGGARYQFSPRAAFTADVRLSAAFGQGTLLTYAPELQFQYGF